MAPGESFSRGCVFSLRRCCRCAHGAGARTPTRHLQTGLRTLGPARQAALAPARLTRPARGEWRPGAAPPARAACGSGECARTLGPASLRSAPRTPTPGAIAALAQAPRPRRLAPGSRRLRLRRVGWGHFNAHWRQLSVDETRDSVDKEPLRPPPETGLADPRLGSALRLQPSCHQPGVVALERCSAPCEHPSHASMTKCHADPDDREAAAIGLFSGIGLSCREAVRLKN